MCSTRGSPKKRIFYVFCVTVRAEPPLRALPHTLQSFFCDFFCVHFTLEYGYMCSEKDSAQENKRIGLGGKVGLL